MEKRILGRSGLKVSALGLGCWAIGGPFWRDGSPSGWGQVNDDESIRALHRALELGINFFDTADVYGAGHSERLLGKALTGRREDVVVATKFGNVFNEETKIVIGRDYSPGYIQRACESSLQRLGTDYIDIYQLHPKDVDLDTAESMLETLERLAAQGKIRYYGWSTDDPVRAQVFAKGNHCTSIQHTLSVLDDNKAMLEVCERENLASINRGPLARGLLTGKFSTETTFPPDDVRNRWDLKAGKEANRLEKLNAVKEILQKDGHSLTQAAIAWIWTRSELTVPITGFKTVRQVEENVGALSIGPLSEEQMDEIEKALAGIILSG